MPKSLISKLKILKTNLNIGRTVKLIFAFSKGWTILVILAILIETLFMLASLYSLKLIVDVVSKADISNPQSRDLIIKYIFFSIIIGVCYNVTKTFSAYISEVQAAKVSEKIDDKIHEIAKDLELSYYESPEYFDILKRAKDAGSFRPNQVILSLLDITKNILSLLGIAIVLATISKVLLPILILLVIPTLLIRIYFSKKQNLLRVKQTPAERKSMYLSNLITSDTAAKEVRSYNLGTFFKDQYYTIRMQLLSEKLKISFVRTLGESVSLSISNIGFFVCIGYILLNTSSGSLGSLALFLVIFPQSFNLLQSIATGISNLYMNNIFVSSIYELFDLVPVKEATKKYVSIPKKNDLSLKLKNVNFSYPGSGKMTLSNISMEIPAGKIIAVVGLNGAGKTTLIKILAGLYHPNSGLISLGEENVNSFSISDYRKQIGIVFQDFNKYNFSAADNIRFGDMERTEHKIEDIKEAAIKTGANLYIDDFINGYDTIMGKVFDNGQEISIGQWQKLATARALYSSSRFLILDEATSALDVIAEKYLFDSFRENIGTRGALIISHRHSAVKHADYIYVLSNGMITQQGTDEELLNLDGDYARLFSKKNE